MQGNYSDLLVILSSVYSELRGDSSAVQQDDSAQVPYRCSRCCTCCCCSGGPVSCSIAPHRIALCAALHQPGTVHTHALEAPCLATSAALSPSARLSLCPICRQGMDRSTTKYWVRMSDVSTVKHHILQHLPVFQFNQGRDFTGDAQLINSGEGSRPEAVRMQYRSACVGAAGVLQAGSTCPAWLHACASHLGPCLTAQSRRTLIPALLWFIS